jgi:hypothetical protein
MECEDWKLIAKAMPPTTGDAKMAHGSTFKIKPPEERSSTNVTTPIPMGTATPHHLISLRENPQKCPTVKLIPTCGPTRNAPVDANILTGAPRSLAIRGTNATIPN